MEREVERDRERESRGMKWCTKFEKNHKVRQVFLMRDGIL